MLENNNIGFLVFSIIPAMIYGLVVLIHTPPNSVNKVKLLLYPLIGLISLQLINLLHTAFPSWGLPLFTDLYGGFTIASYMSYAFIQVALVEEIAKFFSYWVGSKIDLEKKENPISIMLYSMMVAVGFATIETFEYANQYEAEFKVGSQVVFIRSISAILLHMSCGIIMGYYIARGSFKYRNEKKTIFNIYMAERPILKRITYSAFGIFMATLLHGIYDLNLFIEMGYIVLITLSALVMSYIAFIDLIKRTEK